MLLQELTLHDFRTYGGRQTINLAPTHRDKPIVLFGGLNGAGKTTLLDALQLALYGQRARCASRGEMAYKTYLRQAVHRRADPAEGAGVELTFSHASEGRERQYRVRRNWYATGSGVSERVEVEVDGQLDPILTDQWDERVDDFAPHRISHLFFFDGEKIAALAEEEGSAEVLRTAIYSLLGLELVDRLAGDLAILDQKMRREGNIQHDRRRAEQLEDERNHLTSELEKGALERASLHKLLDSAKKALDKIQALYQSEGGELSEQRSNLEAQLSVIQGNRMELRDRLLELTTGCLPLAIVHALLNQVESQAQGEEQLRQHALLADLLGERDRALLARLTEESLPKKTLEQLSKYMAEDRLSRTFVPREPAFLALDAAEVKQLDRIVRSEMPAQAEQARIICAEIEKLSEQALVVDRRLKSIPEEGDLADLRDRRSEALLLVESLKTQLAIQEERQRVLQAQHDSATEKYRRELEKELVAAQANEGTYLKLERMKVASETLGVFRNLVLKRNLGRVEGAILESFQNLIRKPNLVSRIAINANDFALDLIGENDQPLRREQLSAGEAQLLAVSILWGLARTAGLPLPVVIDTPLGRLDSHHRGNLVERYFPQASHQVLLLSTDEEIGENRLQELAPYIGRSYLLEYIAAEDRTLVREGYFN